jgi:hypothetical protein
MTAETKPARAKKAYRAPRLRAYGDVSRITRGNIPNLTPDSMAMQDNNKTMS